MHRKHQRFTVVCGFYSSKLFFAILQRVSKLVDELCSLLWAYFRPLLYRFLRCYDSQVYVSFSSRCDFSNHLSG